MYTTITPQLDGAYTWPSIQPQISYPYTDHNYKIKKADNGYIIDIGLHKYICEELQDIVNIIKEYEEDNNEQISI